MEKQPVRNLDAVVSMDDAQHIQELALVFMNSLDLDVKHGINADLYEHSNALRKLSISVNIIKGSNNIQLNSLFTFFFSLSSLCQTRIELTLRPLILSIYKAKRALL